MLRTHERRDHAHEDEEEPVVMEAPRKGDTPHQVRLLGKFKTIVPPSFDGIGISIKQKIVYLG